MRNDLIIDFETMSDNESDCAVIDCAAFVFDWDRFTSDNPYTMRDIANVKRFKLSIAHQVKDHGFKVSKDTIKFWINQSKEVQKRIAPKSDDLTVEEYCNEFLQFLADSPKIEYWWSRSNLFDPSIIYRLFRTENKVLNLNQYLHHWRLRDTRTHIDAKFDYTTKNGFIPVGDEDFWGKVFQEHNSSWDVLADVLRLQAIKRAEEDLEQVKR